MKKQLIDYVALDSVRHIDDNGYLHIAVSPLTKETVNPYWGHEVPGWQTLGLDPDKMYYGYRTGEELKKALATFNGLPLLDVHKVDSSDQPLKQERVGSVGTSAVWDAPYIKNAITVTDSEAIKDIENGTQKELSASYRYVPVFEAGVFDGMPYDFIMTDIKANHVALVREGRAGADVCVYDEKIKGAEKMTLEELKKMVEELAKAIASFEGASDNASACDEDMKKAMDTAGMDSESEEMQKAFAEGVKYGEKLEKSEPKKLDSEHESEGMKKAMDEAGMDSESAEMQKAFAEGVKYGERLEKSEPKKLDSEHESEGAKKAMDEDEVNEAMDTAIKRSEKKVRDLYEAVDDVRSTVTIKAHAYDSAEDVYAVALKKMGIAFDSVPKAGYKALYHACKNVAKQQIQSNVGFAQDGAAEEESAYQKNVIKG